MQTIRWHKSSYSGDGSNCLEIAPTPTAIHIRDSKTTPGPRITVSPSAWAAFLSRATAR